AEGAVAPAMALNRRLVCQRRHRALESLAQAEGCAHVTVLVLNGDAYVAAALAQGARLGCGDPESHAFRQIGTVPLKATLRHPAIADRQQCAIDTGYGHDFFARPTAGVTRYQHTN